MVQATLRTSVQLLEVASRVVNHHESSLSGQVLGVEVRKQKEFLHGDAFQRPVAACISSSISSSASSTSFANKHPFQFGLSISKYARKGLA